MFGTIKRLAIALAVLGGMLIALHFVLHQLQRHAPAPVSTVAGRVESLVSGN